MLCYCDNAATSWPKPGTVIQAMADFQAEIGGNPGRSGHSMSIGSARVIFATRMLLCELFNVEQPEKIIFTKNTTEALNYAIVGLLRKGDHVITSSVEHNSVMRPLRYLERCGIELTVVPCSHQGVLDPEDVKRALKPNTRAVVINHASNVIGTILPIKDIGRIIKENSSGTYFVVDAAQTAGVLEIDIKEAQVDLLAFAGHKGLCGPMGTGGLAIGTDVKIPPLLRGGTGSRSELEEQPDFLPDALESGTPNAIGIAGLKAGVEFINKVGLEQIRKKEEQITGYFLKEVNNIPGVIIYGTGDAQKQVAVVSLNVSNMVSSQVANRLDEEFQIMTRPGLHCAPAAHKTIGTYSCGGTVRVSFNYFNTFEQVDYLLNALRAIVSQKG